MTENKRFGISSEYEDNILDNIFLITVNDESYNIYEVLELLQKLDKENQQLKEENEQLRMENEQLKLYLL